MGQEGPVGGGSASWCTRWEGLKQKTKTFKNLNKGKSWRTNEWDPGVNPTLPLPTASQHFLLSRLFCKAFSGFVVVCGKRKAMFHPNMPLQTKQQHPLSFTAAVAMLIRRVSAVPNFSLLSSRYGRRPLLLASYLGSILFAVLSAFSTSYIMFVIMRFFTGVALAGIAIISFVLSEDAD